VRCPFCAALDDKVIDSRASKDGREIRRRRECDACGRRYTTYERVEESMPMVVKVDGRREPFDRNKVERGLHFAFAKRPVAQADIKALAEDIEREVSELGVPEIPSREIGERVLPKLRVLDQVAYVRFASIYRDFRDLDGFAKELDALKGGHEADVEQGAEVERLADRPAAPIAPPVEAAGAAPRGMARAERAALEPAPPAKP
jgi:transcriptional repressor NrdR